MSIVTANKIKHGSTLNLTDEVHDLDYEVPTVFSAEFIRTVEKNGWTAQVIRTSFRKNGKIKITLRSQTGLEETRTFKDFDKLETL